MNRDPAKIIEENKIRNGELDAYYNPVKGIGSPIKRFEITFSDIPLSLFIPETMKEAPITSHLLNYTTLLDAAKSKNMFDYELWQQFIEERLDHDFEFWAATLISILNKDKFKLVLFHLRGAQRKLLYELEMMRVAGVPIRIVLLKARQWGGSTLVDIYGMWIQQRHREYWHMVICAQDDAAAGHISSMYDTAIENYPIPIGKLVPVKGSSKNRKDNKRNGRINIGSINNPNQFRSYNNAIVHMSETGIWEDTPKRTAMSVVSALKETVPDQPYTMIVEESTARGLNYFYDSWIKAMSGKTRYKAVFVAWWEIDRCRENITIPAEEFIKGMTDYDWFMWNTGATIEGINWYNKHRDDKGYSDWMMMEENPTTWEEAFQSSGQKIFAPVYVDAVAMDCTDPIFIGDVFAKARIGENALKEIRFEKVTRGRLWLWKLPEEIKQQPIKNRLCAFVDIGGRTDKADFSVIKLVDREPMLYGEDPEVVAVWHGHCFVPDTLIYTANGFRKIKDIKEGELVWTHKNRFRKVIQTYKRKHEGELLSIRTQGNYETVKCTPEHPFLSNNVCNKATKIRKIYNGIKCYSYSSTEQIGEEKWVEAKDLEYIAYSRIKDSRKRTNFIINKYNGGRSKDTKRVISDMESFFAILGYYLAEGHINKRRGDKKPDKIVFSFGYHERDNIAQDCYLKLKKLGFSPSIKEKKDVGVCLVRISDTNFASLVLDLCGEHSWEKMINPKILEYSKKLLLILLECYWRGDGSAYRTNNTESNTATTVSPILARQIRDILILLGHRPGIYRVVAKTKGKNIKNVRPRYNVVWTTSKLKKYSLLQNDKTLAYKVKSKTSEGYSGDVYNLEVEEDNSYSTESYIVHNCDQDLFAWKCAQICMAYSYPEIGEYPLLAFETQSLNKGEKEGDHSLIILDTIKDYYPNLYIRNDKEKIGDEFVAKYGWHSSRKEKTLIIDTLNGAMRKRYLDKTEEFQDGYGYVERDIRACQEFKYFETKSDGSMGAIQGKKDDHVIVSAGSVWLAISRMDAPKLIVDKPKPTIKRKRGYSSF